MCPATVLWVTRFAHSRRWVVSLLPLDGMLLGRRVSFVTEDRISDRAG